MVTARIAEEKERFGENGYECQDTEIGKVFYPPGEFIFGEVPEIRMLDFWGTSGIRAKDIKTK